jgi:hypothetical protein
VEKLDLSPLCVPGGNLFPESMTWILDCLWQRLHHVLPGQRSLLLQHLSISIPRYPGPMRSWHAV